MDGEIGFIDIKSSAKRELRRRILQKREALSAGERKRAATLITDRIAGHQWFYRCENLLIFVSYGSEIETKGIIQEAFKVSKKVFVPRVEGKEIRFYRINRLDELREGYKGIPEPVHGLELFDYDSMSVDDRKKTLLIMPGVAFDAEKNRLGYGKGFYDRFLADKEELKLHSIAIGYRCQMTELVPHTEHDLRPDQVITV